MSSLQEVKLSNNQLRFDISKIKLPSELSSLDLHGNLLIGSLTTIINSMTSSSSEVIDVSNNYISGHIPEFVEGSSLKVLNLGSNNISGSIPDSISNLIELEMLDISRNHIMGKIPSSLGQLQKLQWLDVSINEITGQIPGSLSQITNLKHASFRANRLCGEIPQTRPFNIFPPVAYAHNLCLCGKPLGPCKG
uniref:Non-specific serine/threonine protein kinase n=1 Tax=Medicago truncatula TaxID=3880 RepID=I3SAE6_MEDTR|nr:unknown [Medicago truncatula]